jgi:hypothetical protein
MELKEQGRYGHPESDLFGKCEICGCPIDKHLTHCLRCKSSTLLKSPIVPDRRRRFRIWRLLLLTLTAWGLYWFANHIDDRRAETSMTGVESSEMRSSFEPPSPNASAREHAPAVSRHDTKTETVHLNQTRSQPPVQSTAGATASAQQASRPKTSHNLITERIVCPACAGRGRISHEAPRNGTYTCPVCAGKGYRNRRFLAANWRLCDVCGGMGCLPEKDDLFRTRNRIVKKTCPKCAGRGLLPLVER